MTFNYDVCPVLTDKNIGLSMMGCHHTECGDVIVDNQTIIDACTECLKPKCFYILKGKQRREIFKHEKSL